MDATIDDLVQVLRRFDLASSEVTHPDSFRREIRARTESAFLALEKSVASAVGGGGRVFEVPAPLQKAVEKRDTLDWCWVRAAANDGGRRLYLLQIRLGCPDSRGPLEKRLLWGAYFWAKESTVDAKQRVFESICDVQRAECVYRCVFRDHGVPWPASALHLFCGSLSPDELEAYSIQRLGERIADDFVDLLGRLRKADSDVSDFDGD